MKIEYHVVQLEEINKDDFYRWKRYCVYVLEILKKFYKEEGYESILKKYRRVSYDDPMLRKTRQLLPQEITSETMSKNYSINLINYKSRTKVFVDTDVPYTIIGRVSNIFDVIDMWRIKYIECKRKFLSGKSQPSLRHFLSSYLSYNDNQILFYSWFEKSLLLSAKDV